MRAVMTTKAATTSAKMDAPSSITGLASDQIKLTG
jgi:hypothetical protein